MAEVRFSTISYREFLDEWKLFIVEFLKQYSDYEIVFVPHIFRDMNFINDILDILPDSLRRQKITIASLKHGEESFAEVMSVYKGASLVLANRFHANVCSIGLGVPTIGLVNYRQIKELYRELGSDNFVDIERKGFNNELMKFISINLINLDSYQHNLMVIEKKYLLIQTKINLWMNTLD